jgi:hypothetical protein
VRQTDRQIDRGGSLTDSVADRQTARQMDRYRESDCLCHWATHSKIDYVMRKQELRNVYAF